MRDSLFPDLNASRSAIISPCGRYRYTLTRRVGQAGGVVNFVMLNPSTADAEDDDATIRRCIGFARSWGYGDMVVTNLFAWRSTDPKGLLSAIDPIGPENDYHLANEARLADLIVCAWGTPGKLKGRAAVVLDMLGRIDMPHCLARTKQGQPGHPLYLAGDLKPVPMEEPR